MSDASTAHGTEPAKPIKQELFFPSEGDFSTVVPLSQVARAPFAAERSEHDGRPAEAAWAREKRRGARVGEEEETLVPARAGKRRGARVDSQPGAGQRPWTVTAAAVLLSVLAGVAAGSYLVWSKRPAGSPATAAAETASREVAADIPPPVVEVEPVAPEPPARATTAATEAKPERSAETASRAEKSTPPAAERSTRAAAQPRTRVERAAPDTTATTPAPRPARNDAPTRRAVTTAEQRPTRPATPARQLPVSAPPPSSKSKTVIQWP